MVSPFKLHVTCGLKHFKSRWLPGCFRPSPPGACSRLRQGCKRHHTPWTTQGVSEDLPCSSAGSANACKTSRAGTHDAAKAMQARGHLVKHASCFARALTMQPPSAIQARERLASLRYSGQSGQTHAKTRQSSARADTFHSVLRARAVSAVINSSRRWPICHTINC